MQQRYLPVCSIAQQHSYFQQPQTATVRIVPTPDTARNLQRAGLLVKATATTLVLLRALPTADSGAAPASELPLPEFLFPLRFAIMPTDAYFGNITELPDSLAQHRAEGIRSILFFQAILPSTASVVELSPEHALALPLTPLTVDIQPAPGTQATGPISDLVRHTVLSAGMQKPSATGVSVDLRSWGAGYYELQQAGKHLLSCYADEQLHATQTWGVLHIEQADLNQGPLLIQLMFQARRTRWRYLISYRRSNDLSLPTPQGATIRVKSDNGSQPTPVHFANISPLPQPTTADVVFESAEALALAERPGIACVLHYTMQGAPMEMALPAASGAVLCRPATPAIAPPGPAFSEIVVLL